MHTGFIALHRKLLQNPIFDNPALLKMWLWCLLKATHTEHKQIIGLEVVELNKGQFITGRFAGSKELKVNESTWYKHLKLLEKLEMITLNSNNKYTVVSVVNWELYQVDKKENNNKITTKEQQNNTNNNVNNDNKEYIDANFEKMWGLYPVKRTKTQVTNKSKKEIYRLGDEFERCISRYLKFVEAERKNGFKELNYKNGSTFFNGGYMDYLDESVKAKEELKRPPLKMVYRDNY